MNPIRVMGEARMSLEKNGDLLGLLRMVSASHGGVMLEQIEERFGIDHRTAQRWKNRLLDGVPDVEVVIGGGDRKHRFRLTRPAAGGPADVSADQLAAIDMAIAALGPETKEAAELRRLYDEVRARLPRAKLARVETDHDALLEAQGYVARPGPRPHVDPRVDAAVSEALKASSKVSFAYATDDPAAATTRRVAPLGSSAEGLLHDFEVLVGLEAIGPAPTLSASGRRYQHDLDAQPDLRIEAAVIHTIFHVARSLGFSP